jgi:hypothetical protein
MMSDLDEAAKAWTAHLRTKRSPRQARRSSFDAGWNGAIAWIAKHETDTIHRLRTDLTNLRTTVEEDAKYIKRIDAELAGARAERDGAQFIGTLAKNRANTLEQLLSTAEAERDVLAAKVARVRKWALYVSDYVVLNILDAAPEPESGEQG